MRLSSLPEGIVRKTLMSEVSQTTNLDIPAWLSVALQEQGVRRFGVGECNPRIISLRAWALAASGTSTKNTWC